MNQILVLAFKCCWYMYDAFSLSSPPLLLLVWYSAVCVKPSFPGCSASKEKANRFCFGCSGPCPAETFSMFEERYPMVSGPCWFSQPQSSLWGTGTRDQSFYLLINSILLNRRGQNTSFLPPLQSLMFSSVRYRASTLVTHYQACMMQMPLG